MNAALDAAPAPAATSSLLVADFDFDLPRDLIAQRPLERRDASRLLVLGRESGSIQHSSIALLPQWIAPGDLLVANNSRVIPARLRGRKLPSGGAVEILLLRRENDEWLALARPAKRLPAGVVLEFPLLVQPGASATAVVTENQGGGEIRLRFNGHGGERLEAIGEAPLPPYITATLDDPDRYQTVYARESGSAAAPTAGLHFTKDLLLAVAEAGVDWAEVTLHVGLDTFRPVAVDRVLDHVIHQEWCEVSDETALKIAACRARGGRVIAVGTTAARTLETLGRVWIDARPQGLRGLTGVFIVPGHRWKLVDGLLTNFHLPRSTLLMMVSALASRDSVLHAYEAAIRERYRFYSFGDAMLIQ